MRAMSTDDGFGPGSLALLALAGCIAIALLMIQLDKRKTTDEATRPQVTILNISSEKTFYDREIVVVEYLHGVEPRVVTLADYDQVERFLAILERQATVDWLGAAE